jgi:y4mF family transcriptional regulator
MKIRIFIPERVFKHMEKLSQFVKGKRKSLGLTQKDLSFKSGVGLRFVRDLEQGKESLMTNKVNQILFLFGHELGPVPSDREEEEHS